MAPSDKLHGQVINFKDISKYIPIRDKFLNKDLYKKVNSDINGNKDLLFMPSSTHEMNMQQAEYKKSKYKLVLFGIFEDGRRGTICINNIKPYFEIKIKDNSYKNKDDLEKIAEEIFNDINMEGEEDFNKFNTAINRAYGTNQRMPTFGFKIEPTKWELCTGKPLHVFQEHESNYIKIYFDKLEHRKNAINYVRALGYETAHDDINSYYRVASRDYLLPLAQWLIISDYMVDDSNKYLKGSIFQVDIDNISIYKEELTKHLLKDNTMTMAFDIETYNANHKIDGEVPLPKFPKHNMFMISMVFQFFHASDQLLNVCLVDVSSAPNPDFLTIICDNEQNLIRGFAQIFNKLQPEIVMGFNSDNYDWPWIIERAQSYKGLLAEVVELFDFTIQKDRTDQKAFYSYKKNSTKIEATTNVDGQNLQTPGFIPFDVCTCFRQLYSTSEQWSLNFFLSKNKLGGKEDMPYKEMFQIYEDTLNLVKSGKEITQELLDKMSLVGKYCVVDSIRCHDLTSIRSILQDRREIANISYTSLFDAFYRANGMKVRNLVMAEGNKRNLKISNIALENVENGKYPGAFVIPPTKGLNVSKLSIRERIEKANLGYEEYKEWKDVTEEEIQEYIKIIDQEQVSDTPNHLRKMITENTGRPITGLDFSSLYPSLMMAYNLSPEYMIVDLQHAKAVNKIMEGDNKKHELHKIKFDFNGRTIRGWSVRHDNKLDSTKSNFKFGLFPSILKGLFDDRKKLKNGLKGLVHYEHEKERLLGLPKEEFETSEIQEQYEDVCFRYNSVDSKQRGLKVFMNTFYGESGNKRSPLFMLQVAGGITTAGVNNIKMVYNFVQEQGCKVYYGDSVKEDCPILIRYTTGPLAGNIDIVTIDNIPRLEDESIKWKLYPQFKPNEGKPHRIKKLQMTPYEGLQTWTSSGWSNIKRVIKHKTNKKMFRINTHTGVIDVTEDHSLISLNREKIKPTDVEVGTELFHSYPSEFSSETKFENSETIVELKHCNKCNKDKPLYEFYITGNACKECEWFKRVENGFRPQMKVYFSEEEYLLNTGKNLTEEEAYVWGFFGGDGSCGEYDCDSGVKRSWAINNSEMKYLNQLLDYLAICEPNFKFKILDTIKSSGVYKLVPIGRVKLLVEKYRNLFYDKRDYKIVPRCILNSPINIRRAYLNGFHSADGYKNGEMNDNTFEIHQKSKISSQCLYYLMKSVGYDKVIIKIRDDKPNVYSLRCHGSGNSRKPLNAIKKIIELPSITQEDYVYDIETEDGTFQGGVGNMIISNTDSIYLAMSERDFKQADIDYYTEKISKLEYWEKMVQITFEKILALNEDVNLHLRNDNGTSFLKMAYEEILFPSAFLAKKKYFGIPHLSKANFTQYNMFIRGLALKTRGVSEVLIEVCDSILKSAVCSTNILTITEIVESKIREFYNSDWTTPDKFTAFIMTGVYKPNKQNVKMHTFHDRMLQERNITIIPNDRIKYVIVKKYPYAFDMRGRKSELSVGDKMELADIALEENLPIDIDYYMDKTINGQLARFVTYHDNFQAPFIGIDYSDFDQMKKAENDNLKLARKYIDNFCKQYYTNYSNKGPVYKSVFKKSAKIVERKIIEKYGGNESSNTIIKLLGFSVDPEDNLEEWILNRAHTLVEKKNKLYGVNYVDKLLNDYISLDKSEDDEKTLTKKEKTVMRSKYIIDLQEAYYANKNNNILRMSENQYNERQQILETRFRQSINKIKNTYHMNLSIIDSVSKHIKSAIDIDNNFNTSIVESSEEELPKDLDVYLETLDINVDEFNETLDGIADETIQSKADMLEGIAELKFLYHNLMSNYEYIYNIRSIVEYLKTLRDKTINNVKSMSKVDTAKMIDEMVSSSIDLDFKF